MTIFYPPHFISKIREEQEKQNILIIAIFLTAYRKCLLYKLINCEITGKNYQVMKNAYETPQFCVKTMYGLSEYFSSTTGVKQGCILSPVLSNIFQNDLHECFNKNRTSPTGRY